MLLPYALRRPIVVALLNNFVAQFGCLRDTLLIMRSGIAYRSSIDSTVYSLEKMLDENVMGGLGPGVARISDSRPGVCPILQPDANNAAIIVDPAAGPLVYAKYEYVSDYTFSVSFLSDFGGYIDELQVKALLNRYKLAGKNFNQQIQYHSI
jgi:hypothetical protein